MSPDGGGASTVPATVKLAGVNAEAGFDPAASACAGVLEGPELPLPANAQRSAPHTTTATASGARGPTLRERWSATVVTSETRGPGSGTDALGGVSASTDRNPLAEAGAAASVIGAVTWSVMSSTTAGWAVRVSALVFSVPGGA